MWPFNRKAKAARRVYRSPLGTYHDPLKVRRDLELLSDGAVAGWVEEQRAGSLDADEKVLGVVRAAFGFAPIDRDTGAGVTDTEALTAFADYQEYLAGKGGRG
jgi:hypothetical protein